VEDKKEKVIIKSVSQPGIDLSVVDLTLVSTVKVRFTKVTKLMFKKKWLTYIGTKDQLDVHDVIQLGCLKLKYKVQKLEKMTDREGYIYKIRRIGDSNTTQLDLDNVKLGDTVHIINRKTFDQMFNYACSLREENPIPTTVCENELLPCETCDEDEPVVVPPEPEPCPPGGCVNYTIVFEKIDQNNTFKYIGCSGEEETWDINVNDYSNINDNIISTSICGKADQDFTGVILGDILLVIPGSQCGPCTDPERTCDQVNVTVPGGVGTRYVVYVDCNGEVIVDFHVDSKGSIEYSYCVQADSTVTNVGYTPVAIITNQNAC